MHSLSFGELAIIFGIIIVLFGGSRLASVGKSLGEGISNFKKGLNAANDDEKKAEEVSIQQKTPQQVDGQSKQANVVDVEHKESVKS